MNILEQFLHNISYKFPKGYPDLNDKNDFLILENEFKKIGIDLNELESIRGHWEDRVKERGNILDITNFPKDSPISKQEVIEQIQNELISRTLRLKNLKEFPASTQYEIGYKLMKPVLNYNGKNIILNLKVEYITGSVKKIGTGNSYIAVISDNILATLLLLSNDDNSTIESSLELHAARKKRKSKSAKVVTPSNYEFIIAPLQQDVDTKLDPTTLPYKLRTDYRKGADFEHKQYGRGTIVNTSAGSGGKGDSRGRVDWIEVKYDRPYLSGGQLKNTRRFEKIYTSISPDVNVRAAE
jgi:hypothetical protein